MAVILPALVIPVQLPVPVTVLPVPEQKIAVVKAEPVLRNVAMV